MSNKRQIYIMIIICIVLFIVSFLSFKFYFLNYSELQEPNLMPNTQPTNITPADKTKAEYIVSISDEELIRINKILARDEKLGDRAYAYAEAMVKQDIEKGIIPKGYMTLEEEKKSNLSFKESLKLQQQEEARFNYYLSEYTKTELEKRAKMKKEVK